MTIPQKIKRCHNDKCVIKNKCLRWKHRDDLNAKYFLSGSGDEGCKDKLTDIKDASYK